MQTKAPVFDDLANLMTNAFGAAKGVGDEVRAAGRARAESFIADMDLVGQMQPNYKAQFKPISMAEALAARMLKQEKLQQVRERLKHY